MGAVSVVQQCGWEYVAFLCFMNVYNLLLNIKMVLLCCRYSSLY